jgi:hypothetical protein
MACLPCFVDFGGYFIAVGVSDFSKCVNLTDMVSVLIEALDGEPGIQYAMDSLDFLGDGFFKFGFELSIAREHTSAVGAYLL